MERLYIRGSDDRINTDNQLLDLRAASPAGLLYQDTETGSVKRPELGRLISECQPGDVVWIWSLDRLSREGISATLEYLKAFTARHVRVRSIREPWLDSESPCYEMLVACMSFVSKLERDTLIARTKQGIKRKRLNEGRPVIDKNLILAARAQGMTYSEIGTEVGCTRIYAFQVCKAAGQP